MSAGEFQPAPPELIFKINAVLDPSFEDFRAEMVAARELDLPEDVLERLRGLCDGIGDRIVCGDMRPAATAHEFDALLRLQFPLADRVLLAALRTRDLRFIAHAFCLSVGGVAAPTVSPDGTASNGDSVRGGGDPDASDAGGVA